MNLETTGDPLQESPLPKEKVGNEIPIVVCSGGRGGEVAQEIGQSLARAGRGEGVEILTVSPEAEVTEDDLVDLGALKRSLSGEVHGPSENSDIVAWLKSSQEARASSLVGRTSSFLSVVARWGEATAAVAFRKLRPVAHRLLSAYSRGLKSFNEVLYARDTTEIGFGKGEEETYFSHPGSLLKDQKEAAEKFASMEYATIVTASAIVAAHFNIRNKELLAPALCDIYEFGKIEEINLTSRQDYSYSSARALADFMLIRVKESEKHKIGELPDECFGNVPGGG